MKLLIVIFVTTVVVLIWFPCEANSKKTVTVMISYEKWYPLCQSGQETLMNVKLKMIENFGKMFNVDIVLKEAAGVENRFDISSESMQDL